MIDALVQYILALNNLLGGNLGVTFIVIGIAVRVVFTPLLRKQLDHTEKMRQLQPKINALKKKHKNDKTALAQAQTKLFQEEGLNPAAGCLPMIVQIGAFALLYQAINQILHSDIQTSFLGINLLNPDVIEVSGIPFPLPGLIIVLAGVSQLLLSKLMMPHALPVNKDDDKDEKEDKVDLMEEIAQAQGQMVYLFPIMFIVLGYQFPAGLSLYWLASTVTALIQQMYLTNKTPTDLINAFKPAPKATDSEK